MSQKQADDPQQPSGQKADGAAAPAPRAAEKAASRPEGGLTFPFSRSSEEDEIREMYGWGV